MKFKLIPNWREAYKYATVQLALLIGLLATAFEYLPAMQTYFPQNWVQYASAIIIVARIIKQNHDTKVTKNADTTK